MARPNIPDYVTCITCRVAFKDADLQRRHFKTDWHRYNLKRKVAELPSVTYEEYERRVNNQRNADETAKQDTNVYCTACRKTFGNQNAFSNHLHSKKHKENEKSSNKAEDTSKNSAFAKKNKTEKTETSEDDSEVEEVDSDEWDDEENSLIDNHCLFCKNPSSSFIENLEHMTIAHSFFVPDIEYCTDLPGLLRYLGQKVAHGYMCLWCNDRGRTFHSADAARQHMVDKGHCQMIHEGIALAEYAEYYDYSSSYPDVENETVEDEEEVTVPEIDGTDFQLTLPSGISVGHRSLMRYYKQNPNINRVVAVPAKNTKKLHKVLAQYRALGWTETQQAAAAKKARDLHYMKRMQSKYDMKMGLKNNVVLQQHFRRQVQF